MIRPTAMPRKAQYPSGETVLFARVPDRIMETAFSDLTVEERGLAFSMAAVARPVAGNTMPIEEMARLAKVPEAEIRRLTPRLVELGLVNYPSSGRITACPLGDWAYSRVCEKEKEKEKERERGSSRASSHSPTPTDTSEAKAPAPTAATEATPEPVAKPELLHKLTRAAELPKDSEAMSGNAQEWTPEALEKVMPRFDDLRGTRPPTSMTPAS